MISTQLAYFQKFASCRADFLIILLCLPKLIFVFILTNYRLVLSTTTVN